MDVLCLGCFSLDGTGREGGGGFAVTEVKGHPAVLHGMELTCGGTCKPHGGF